MAASAESRLSTAEMYMSKVRPYRMLSDTLRGYRFSATGAKPLSVHHPLQEPANTGARQRIVTTSTPSVWVVRRQSPRISENSWVLSPTKIQDNNLRRLIGELNVEYLHCQIEYTVAQVTTTDCANFPWATTSAPSTTPLRNTRTCCGRCSSSR